MRGSSQAGGSSSHGSGSSGPAGEVLTVALTVPEPWSSAILATITALHVEFDGIPPSPFLPHISLCQPFIAAAPPETIAAAVEHALSGLPETPIELDGAHAFPGCDGSPEVVYVAASAGWLPRANERLVYGLLPLRQTGPAQPGNPAFDLAGFQPHVTLLFMRELTDDPLRRHAAARRAAALWSGARPSGRGFHPTELVLSAIDYDAWLELPTAPLIPRTVCRWRITPAGRIERDVRPSTPLGYAGKAGAA